MYDYESEIAELRRQAEEAQIRADTADMSDEERYKYLYEHAQRKYAEMQQGMAEQEAIENWRREIAGQMGVDPYSLDPRSGVQGMLRQASAQRGLGPQATPPPPSAPAAPQAPASSPGDDLMSLSYPERQAKIPKSRQGFSELMESLGEE